MNVKNTKLQSKDHTLVQARRHQSNTGALVIALPNATKLPVANVQTYGRLPPGVISLARFRELHSAILADLKRSRELQILRNKFRMGSESLDWICDQMLKLNATAEEYVFLLEH
jgi:hypothetical protein